MNFNITIFVLAYNRPDFLDQCLNSINNQIAKNFRVIVIDDASKVNLKSVVDMYDNKIFKYIRNDVNKKLVGNYCFAWTMQIDTPYFIIFHDDDIMHPQYIEKLNEIIEEKKTFSWIGCHSLDFKKIIPEYTRVDKIFYKSYSGIEIITSHIKKINNVTCSSVLYNKKISDKINLNQLVDEMSIVWDRPMLFRLAQLEDCVMIKDKLVFYRNHTVQSIRTVSLTQEHLFNLFLSYKIILDSDKTFKNYKLFYKWSTYNIIMSYNRLNRKIRKSLYFYLLSAFKLNLIDLKNTFLFPVYFFVDFLNGIYKLMTNGFTK